MHLLNIDWNDAPIWAWDANTYMPDGEEDEGSTEDERKHVTKGSEREHYWFRF